MSSTSLAFIRFLLGLTLCLMAFVFSGCFSNPDALYVKSVHLIEQDKLGNAERLLFKVLELKPKHQDAHYSLGVIYMKQERYGEAIPKFEDVLKLNPNDVDSLINLGVIYARQNKLDKAAKMYEEAAKKAPGNNNVLLNLARLLGKQKKYREARLLYEKLLRSQPNLYPANKELGFIYKAEGKFNEATSQFSRASKLKRDDDEVIFQLGFLYHKRGKFKTASKYYLKAASMKGKAQYYLALAGLYENTNQKDDAITAYQKAYQIDKSSYEATYRLGVLTLVKDDYNRARQYLKAAQDLKPRSAEVYKYQGILMIKLKQYDLARKSLNQAKMLNNFVRGIFYHLGMIAMEEDKIAEAVDNFKRELQESPGHIESLVALSSLYRKLGKEEEAMKMLKTILERRQDDARLWDELGTLYLEKAVEEKEKSGLYVALEDFDESIDAFTKAIKLDNSRYDTLEKLLKAYAGARRYAVAIPYLEQMIQVRPKAWEYYPDLARGYVANQHYDKAIDILSQYLKENQQDSQAWFQLGKIHADKGDFAQGIKIFDKAIEFDPGDPKKKLFQGMLLAEVNRFEDALKVLRAAMEQSKPKSVVKKRCEDLIQQILEVSGMQKAKAEETLGKKVIGDVKERKNTRKKLRNKRLVVGSQRYVKTMVVKGLRKYKEFKKAGWTKKHRVAMVKYIKYRLIKNYRQLIKFKKFKNKHSRRYYYLAIRKMIQIVKGKAELKTRSRPKKK